MLARYPLLQGLAGAWPPGAWRRTAARHRPPPASHWRCTAACRRPSPNRPARSAEAELDRRQIVALDVATGAPWSLTRQGPQELSGASNYYVDVAAPDGGAPAARIWLLDSGDRTCPPIMFGWWVQGGRVGAAVGC